MNKARKEGGREGQSDCFERGDVREGGIIERSETKGSVEENNSYRIRLIYLGYYPDKQGIIQYSAIYQLVNPLILQVLRKLGAKSPCCNFFVLPFKCFYSIKEVVVCWRCHC